MEVEDTRVGEGGGVCVMADCGVYPEADGGISGLDLADFNRGASRQCWKGAAGGAVVVTTKGGDAHPSIGRLQAATAWRAREKAEQKGLERGRVRWGSFKVDAGVV